MNIDIKGTKRGKCLSVDCDCEEYFKSDDNKCSMCGCFPAKHIRIDHKDSPRGYQRAAALGETSPPHSIVRALGQLTPTKVATLSLGRDQELQIDSIEPSLSVATPVLSPSPSRDLRRYNAFCIDVVPKLDLGTSADKQTEEIVPVTTERNETKEPRFFNVEKPAFSYDLSKKIKEDGLLKHEYKFYAECASHLLSLVPDGKPTQQEYDLYCSQLIEHFPALQSKIGKTKWAAVKSAISRHLINRRYNQKKTENKSDSAKVKTPKTVESCSVFQSDNGTVNSVEEAMKLLKGVTSQSSQQDVATLIKVTSAARRRLMLDEQKDLPPRLLMESWPHLQQIDWLILDFLELISVPRDQFDENFNVFAHRLVECQRDAESGDEDFAEKTIFRNLAELAKTFKNPKTAQRGTLVISTIEAMGTLEGLAPTTAESPRLVVVFGDHLQCYLLYDGVTVEIPRPTPAGAIAALMGAYYVYDTRYPEPYRLFLQVLEKEILKKKITFKSSQRAATKFYRKFSPSTNATTFEV